MPEAKCEESDSPRRHGSTGLTTGSGHEGFRRVRFAHRPAAQSLLAACRSVSEYLAHPSTALRIDSGHEGFRRVRFAHRLVSEYLAQSTQRAQRKGIGLSPAKTPRRKVKRIRIPNLEAPVRQLSPARFARLSPDSSGFDQHHYCSAVSTNSRFAH